MCTKYDKKYLQMATIWGTNSYAQRNKVGALLVKDNQIISDGYNGTPKGFDNCCEKKEIVTYNEFSLNEYSEEVLVTKPEVLHAEANAITKVAKSNYSSDGSTLYVTLSPCFECAKLIIQAGIKRVVYKETYRNTEGLELLKKAGISVEQINDIDD